MNDLTKKLFPLLINNHLPPCWLIEGSPEFSKNQIEEFSLQLFTDSKEGILLPINVIRKQIEQKTFPNLLTITLNEGEKEITIDQLQSFHTFLQKTPLLNTWRIVIIDCFDQMNRFGMNSILKSLEEPPSKSLIFLLCTKIHSILPTIRSRCQHLTLKKEKVSPTLSEEHFRKLSQCKTPKEIELIAEKCGGVNTLIQLYLEFVYEKSKSYTLVCENKKWAQHWLQASSFWQDSMKAHLDCYQTFLGIIIMQSQSYL